MEFLPTTMGIRPRLAVEVRPEGVVAANGTSATGLIAAVTKVELAFGAVAPGIRTANVVDRPGVVAAVRRVLEGSARGSERGRYVTLVVPDAAVRVLLLDFDALPAKATEALPVVRFRLKKLLPFEVDQSVVTYQIMSSTRGQVQVLAVATPCEVLAEYEGVVTDAGYLPGVVLPSTLAALAGLEEADGPALVVNAGPGGVTTAIVRSGVVLLHRTVDLGAQLGPSTRATEYDRMDAFAEMQSTIARSELGKGSSGGGTVSAADDVVAAVNGSGPISAAGEMTQAVSVAAAYFEDTLGVVPRTLLSAGTVGAERLRGIFSETGFGDFAVREMVSPDMLEGGAPTGATARGWMAGLRGALKI